MVILMFQHVLYFFFCNTINPQLAHKIFNYIHCLKLIILDYFLFWNILIIKQCKCYHSEVDIVQVIYWSLVVWLLIESYFFHM